MKKLNFLLIVVIAAVTPSIAAILGYDPVNSELPNQIDSSWVLANGADPISGFYGSGTIAGINVSGADTGFWYYDGAGLSSSGYTVDFNALVDSDTSSGYYPIQILLYDSGELIMINLGAQEGIVVKQEGGGTRASDASFDTTAYHTYRYVRQGQNFSMYANDIATPLFVGSILDLNNASADRVLFGRAGSDARGTGGLDYLLWNNAQAIEGDPVNNPIPEPTTILILAFGGTLALKRLR